MLLFYICPENWFVSGFTFIWGSAITDYWSFICLLMSVLSSVFNGLHSDMQVAI